MFRKVFIFRLPLFNYLCYQYTIKLLLYNFGTNPDYCNRIRGKDY